MKKKRIVIVTLRSTFNKLRPELPGNLLVNATLGTQFWMSAVDYRNQLIGAGLPLDMPLMTFHGCAVSFDELIITQEMLDANNGQFKATSNGREITFKRPGTNVLNLSIDFSNLNVTDSTVNIAKIKQMMPDRRAFVAPARQVVAPAQTEETIIEDAPPPAEEWVDNGNGTETNTVSGEVRDKAVIAEAAEADLTNAATENP